jgi:hypothetical protein
VYCAWSNRVFCSPSDQSESNQFVLLTWRSHADLPPVVRTKTACLHTLCNSFMSVAQKYRAVRFHGIYLIGVLRKASSA